MKSFSIFALFFFLRVSLSPLYAKDVLPVANDEFQLIDNSSGKIQDGLFLFKNFKVFVPFSQDSKIKAQPGWRTLDFFTGLKKKNDSLFVRSFVFRKLDEDLLYWYEITDLLDGEEGEAEYRSYKLVRLDGKTLKPLWTKEEGIEEGYFDKETCLFTPGFLYVTSGNFIRKFNLDSGKYAWKLENPFDGYSSNFKKPSLANGVLTIQDGYQRILTLDDATGSILKKDYSLVRRNPIPAKGLLLCAAFGSYATYEMFQDHADGLGWVTGSSWALGLLDSVFNPPREDEFSSSRMSYLAGPGLIFSAAYPLIATIDGYINGKNGVSERGWIGMGSEVVFFALLYDVTQGHEDSKTSLRPDFSPRYAGMTWSQSF